MKLSVGERLYRIDFGNINIQMVEVTKANLVDSNFYDFVVVEITERDDPERIVFRWKDDSCFDFHMKECGFFKTQEDLRSYLTWKEENLTKELNTYKNVRKLLFS